MSEKLGCQNLRLKSFAALPEARGFEFPPEVVGLWVWGLWQDGISVSPSCFHVGFPHSLGMHLESISLCGLFSF